MTATTTLWDPELYERYKAYRDRPALDLLLQIPSDLQPREVWDLGCGTGEHAALLAARHPGARVHGLDSSGEMLAVAARRSAPVNWIEGDVAAFEPLIPPDLIFTNAALHWLPDHGALFPRLMRALAPGGVLACQMPSGEGAVHREVLDAAIAAGPWSERLSAVQGVRATASSQQYYDWLAPVSAEIDIWQTTYLHILEGDDPVVDWMSGTGLRPYLNALEGGERGAFLAELRQRLAAAFPARARGEILFPFPRLFIVARRS